MEEITRVVIESDDQELLDAFDRWYREWAKEHCDVTESTFATKETLFPEPTGPELAILTLEREEKLSKGQYILRRTGEINWVLPPNDDIPFRDMIEDHNRSNGYVQ